MSTSRPFSPRWRQPALHALAQRWHARHARCLRRECSPWWTFCWEWHREGASRLAAFIAGQHRFEPMRRTMPPTP